MDTVSTPSTPMTVDDFIAWTREEGVERVELDNGDIVAMAPETGHHALTKHCTAETLRRAVRQAGLDCTVFPDGMTVRIDAITSYIPDALVTCGPVDLDSTEVTDPVIIVEVLSTSTRGADMGRKLSGYFTLASLRHYLMIDPVKRLVIHHRRDAQGAITMQFMHEGALALDPPGLSIDTADLFAP